jgi:hypothetical protein
MNILNVTLNATELGCLVGHPLILTEYGEISIFVLSVVDKVIDGFVP